MTQDKHLTYDKQSLLRLNLKNEVVVTVTETFFRSQLLSKTLKKLLSELQMTLPLHLYMTLIFCKSCSMTPCRLARNVLPSSFVMVGRPLDVKA